MPATAEIPAEHAYPEALALLQEKWVLFIVDALLAGAGGFNDLARRLDGLNSATLAQRLRRLEQAGLVTRRVHGLMPPRTSYELTPRGAALRGVLDAVRDWAGEPGRPAPHPSPAPLPPEEALPCGTSPPGGASGTLRWTFAPGRPEQGVWRMDAWPTPDQAARTVSMRTRPLSDWSKVKRQIEATGQDTRRENCPPVGD